MATSSITKEFYVRDNAAFEKLKKDIESVPVRRQVARHPSLEKGRQKLAAFMFR